MNVPENTPLASIAPDPSLPVVGVTEFWGLNLILQSEQFLANPLPDTVTTVPRAPEVGLKVTFLVIAVNAVEDTAVVSAEVFTDNLLLAGVVRSAAWDWLGFCIPAACRKVRVKEAPAPELIPLSPLDTDGVSISGTVMVTARPEMVTAPADTS